MRRLMILPLVITLLLAPARLHASPGEKPALTTRADAPPATEARPVVERPSTPIELPDAPARPAKDELVGGFIGLVVTVLVVGLIVIIVIGVVIGVAEAHHHHVFYECEECRRRPPPPPYPGP